MATAQAITAAIDPLYRGRAKGVLDTLQSFFLEMPRGGSFCERDDFQALRG